MRSILRNSERKPSWTRQRPRLRSNTIYEFAAQFTNASYMVANRYSFNPTPNNQKNGIQALCSSFCNSYTKARRSFWRFRYSPSPWRTKHISKKDAFGATANADNSINNQRRRVSLWNTRPNCWQLCCWQWHFLFPHCLSMAYMPSRKLPPFKRRLNWCSLLILPVQWAAPSKTSRQG